MMGESQKELVQLIFQLKKNKIIFFSKIKPIFIHIKNFGNVTLF